MDNERIAKELVKLAKKLLNRWHDLNSSGTMLTVARKLNYKIYSQPLKSTVGDTWNLESKRDSLALDITFADDGVWVSVFLLDDMGQDPIVSYEKVKKIKNVRQLVELAKKAVKEANESDFKQHLMIERDLNVF